MKSLLEFRRMALALAIAVLSVGQCFADEVGDSIGSTYNLSEVVVEGRTQRVVENGVEYTPGKKMKKLAMDATSLLTNMQIPQLAVSPVDKSIKTIADQHVSFYINYVPASDEDLKNLRTEDVKSVAVLDYPTDPRFAGSSHVVNFIVSMPDWGGYTRLSLNGFTLSTNDITGGAYEKFIYKNWMFDANVSASGDWNNKSRSYNKETFRNFLYQDQEVDYLERIKTLDYGHKRFNTEQASLRASYSQGGTYMQHTLSYNRSGQPRGLSKGGIRFSDSLLPSTDFEQDNTSTSNNLNVKGYYQFMMPKGNFIMADWSFNYSDNDTYSSYRLGNLSPIVNDVNEKVYTPSATIYYSKSLKHQNTFRTMLSSYANFFDTKYAGATTADQKLTSSESMLFLEYMQNFGFGLSLYSRLGLSYVYGRLNGERISNDWNPRLGLVLDYYMNSKNRFNLEAWWANSAPRAAWTNDAMVRQDELLWITGTPEMRNSYGPMTSLTYTFIPVNTFSLAASVNYDCYHHIPVYSYSRMEGYEGLVRSFSDNAVERKFTAMLSATARLFQNALILSARGNYARELRSGFLAAHQNVFSGTAYAAYYFGPASVTLYYETPTKSMFSRLGVSNNYKCGYGIMVNYAVGDFKAEVRFNNWFSNGRGYQSFSSPAYSSDGWTWISGRNRILNISLSYTFNYGKKVERNDDLQNNASKNSAILE